MALTENVIDIPILTLNQHSPSTDGPIGRLAALVNTQLRQFQRQGDDTHIQVAKRFGYDSLPDVVSSIDGAALGSLPVSGYQFFFGQSPDGPLLCANNRLYSFDGSRWRLNYQSASIGNTLHFPQVLRETDIHSADSTCEASDMAILGDVSLRSWFEVSASANGSGSTTNTALNGTVLLFRNQSTGANIRGPFTYVTSSETYNNVRVISDSNHFWVVQKLNATTSKFRISVFDTDGTLLATDLTATATYHDRWDIAILDGVMVIAAVAGSDGVDFVQSSYDAGVITQVLFNDSTVANNELYCAWLTNDENTSEGFLVTANGADNMDGTRTGTILLYRINATTLQATHTFPDVTTYKAVRAGETGAGVNSSLVPMGISGYRHAGSSPTCSVAVTFMWFESDNSLESTVYGSAPSGINTSVSDLFSDQNHSYIKNFTVPFTGSSVNFATRNSLYLASRAFRIGTDYVTLVFYPARVWGPMFDVRGETATTGIAREPHFPSRPVDSNALQPTWYLVPVDSAQNICGRWDYALAGGDYLAPQHMIAAGASKGIGIVRAVNMSSVVTHNGAVVITSLFRSQQLNSRQTQVVSQPLKTTVTADIGIREYKIGPDFGVPFAVEKTTYVPGLLPAQLESGVYFEQGLHGYEAPQVTQGISASDIYAFGPYLYRNVLEAITPAGNITRSVASPPFGFTESSDDSDEHNIFGPEIYVTLRKYAKNSIYRTTFTQVDDDGENGVPTVQYFKITPDSTPFYNLNDGSQILYEYFDGMEIETQGTGEILYSSLGILPHFPMQSFRGGCVWLNRVWWIGSDNALWFSAEITEGEDPWTNAGFRVPFDDEITSIAPMDETLVVGCASSMWRVDATTLPGPDGQGGAVPRPFRLPFESGCTGHSVTIRPGVLYSSTTGGAWLVTRSLTNVWIGEDASTYLASNVNITGIDVDDSNRVIIGTDAGYQVVYDTVANAWMKWIPATSVVLSSVYNGKPAYVGAGLVWVIDPAIFFDRNNNLEEDTHVEMFVNLSPVHPGNARGWKRTWAVQAQGTKLTDCYFNALLYYDDARQVGGTYYQLPQTGGGLLEVEFNPLIETSTSLDITVWDSITSGNYTTTYSPGEGFRIDIFALQVGMEKGVKRVAATQRAPKVPAP